MIRRIASADDPRLESYRHVGNPALLRHEGLFVAEGRLVVQRLIELGRHSVVSVLVNRAAHDAMLPWLAPLRAEVYVCDDEILTGVTGFNFHRGCLALARRPAPADAGTLFGCTRLLALEGVSNPDNVGSLFRTAAALGAGGVILSPASGDPYYRKAIRTSMGAVLRLRSVRIAGWPEDLDMFRERGFRLVALTPREDAVPLARFALDADPGEKLILLVGSEGTGLGEGALARADVLVRIPIDKIVDSLNVAVAAAIALDRLR